MVDWVEGHFWRRPQIQIPVERVGLREIIEDFPGRVPVDANLCPVIAEVPGHTIPTPGHPLSLRSGLSDFGGGRRIRRRFARARHALWPDWTVRPNIHFAHRAEDAGLNPFI